MEIDIRVVMITILHEIINDININHLSKELKNEYLFLIDISKQISNFKGEKSIFFITQYQKRCEDFLYKCNEKKFGKLEDLNILPAEV